MSILPGFAFGLRQKTVQGLLQHKQAWQQGAEKKHKIIALNQNRREVFDIPILDTRVFVLDIHPYKAKLGILGLHVPEADLVLLASTAPGGAQAHDKEFTINGG